MAFTHTAAHGQLTINGIALMAPWVRTKGLHHLWAGGTPRGDNAQVDGLAGEIGEAWTWAASEYDLKLIVAGDVGPGPTTFAHPQEGLASNLNYLRTHLWAPHTGYAAVLTLPYTAGTLTGDVQIRSFDVGDFGARTLFVAMGVRVLDGVLT